MKNKVLVVGAGAAGLLAAGQAALRGLDVTLLERNERPGRKVMITGKGRCNITNACFELEELIGAVPGNGRFLYSAFSRFMPYDTMALMEEQGVPVKIERGNRVFPQSDKAVDVVDALNRFARRSGAEFQKGRAASLLLEDGAVQGVVLEDGRELRAGGVVIATGGCSYPQTGSTGDGYRLARQAGHAIVPPVPSLVALNAHENWCPQLQGLSLKNAALTVLDTETGKSIYSDFGEMLFTHFGVSGPMVLSASAHLRPMAPRRYQMQVDLKPALSMERLDARLQRDFAENANRDLINSLGQLLPQKMIPVMVRLAGLDPHGKCNQITRKMRHTLAENIKRLVLTVTGFRPIEEAVITSGGVDVRQVSPKTMESKLVRNLYFAGEVLDVDAYTGGFNLQIAFSTGYLAGNSILEETK